MDVQVEPTKLINFIREAGLMKMLTEKEGNKKAEKILKDGIIDLTDV